jgi:hypothetical protein
MNSGLAARFRAPTAQDDGVPSESTGFVEGAMLAKVAKAAKRNCLATLEASELQTATEN